MLGMEITQLEIRKARAQVESCRCDAFARCGRCKEALKILALERRPALTR